MTSIPCEYTDTLLSVSNVNVTLGGSSILRDVNLEIKNLVRPGYTQGQVVGLLGPSGIGKTTLFRILAGLEAPDTGTVLVEKECRPVQRGMVGVVAQSYPLFAHRTVKSNLTVAGRQAGLSGGAAAQKANELLTRFDLAEHAQKYPAQLSGGQRQRVAIAQQLLCSEHFLLMDEPFSGLDLIAVERVSNLIAELAQSDELKTFIIVTHDIGAAIQVCDTLVLLGRDRDSEGNVIPGARIQASYNLVERGLAWRKGITTTPEFLVLLQDIREKFPRL
ncbi:MAG: ATP-binding cassette domain-containing protein [Armatimonadota bacterium]|nr:ATP-binding cassette domain-containing protein [Armatimonadota bacterium]